MKRILRGLLIIILKIVLTIIWGALSLAEVICGELAKWIETIIKNHLKL